MVGDEVEGEDKSGHVIENLKSAEFVRSVDKKLIEDRTALQAEVREFLLPGRVSAFVRSILNLYFATIVKENA